MLAAVIVSVRLVYSEVTSPSTSPIQFQQTVVFNQYSVPANATSHICVGADMRNVFNDTLWHATNFSLIVDNTAVVEKIILHGCFSVVPEDFYECNYIPSQCMGFVWAPPLDATASLDLPIESGVLFGEDPSGMKQAITFVLLHIYYANPDLIAGYRDSSGVSIEFTNALRANDAATLTVYNSSFTLPADTESTVINSACSINPAYPLVAIGYSFQEHSYGSSAYLSSSTGTIGEDDNFNFTSSGFTSLNGTVLPPGELTLMCTYNTLTSSQAIASGLSPTQEECSSFILYYPAMDAPILCSNSSKYS